jgi:ComF family protein
MAPITGETCDVCGDSVLGSARTEGAQVLADSARSGNQRGGAPLFAGVGRSGTKCSSCQQERLSFTKAKAYGPYNGGLRELIHLLKYERVEPAASVLGAMLSVAIGKLDLSAEALLIVSVPLHTSKSRERGFNQAELIARSAVKELGHSRSKLIVDGLGRIRPTVSQIGLTRPQRRENIRGAFRVSHPTKIAGRDMLLVDDVMTTGTTASECARILRKAGAQNVWVATVARTLKNQEAFEIGPRFEAAQAS